MLFIFVIIVCLVVTVIFVNILSNDKKVASSKVLLTGLEFHAVGTRGINNKSKAMEMAYEIRSNGGAGFVSYDGEWFVLQEFGIGNLKFSAGAVEVMLKNPEHKNAFKAIIQSFNNNSSKLQGLLQKPAREVAAESLLLYNELTAAISKFDEIQGSVNSVMYSEVLVAANKHLLALFLLSTEKDTKNIPAALKHCICSVNFAYLDLLTSIKTS